VWPVGMLAFGGHPFSVFPSSSPRFRVVGEHVKPREANHTIKIFRRPSVENRDAISKKPYSNSSLSACVCICKKVQRFNTLCYDLRFRVPPPGFACSQEWKGGCTNLGII